MGHVQPVVFPRKGEAHQARLYQGIIVLLCTTGIFNFVINQLRTLFINRFGIRANDPAADLPDDLHNLVVTVDRIFIIERGEIKFVFLVII